MRLQPWMVAAGWKEDVAAFYRASVGRVTQVVLVPGLESVPGRRKATSNFDRPKGFSGQANQDNFDTSDEFRLPMGYDVRAADLMHYKPTDEWFVIAGAGQEKTLFPKLARQVCFITTTVPPLVAEGSWDDGTGSYSGVYEGAYPATY